MIVNSIWFSLRFAKYQPGFLSVLAKYVASIPIVVLMVLPRTQGNEPGYGHAALRLGELPGRQMLKEIMLLYSTPAIIIAGLLYGLCLLDDFARPLL